MTTRNGWDHSGATYCAGQENKAKGMCVVARRGVLLLMWALLAFALAGCGYQFTGRAMGEHPVVVDVTSDASEMGLALAARRGLETHITALGGRVVSRNEGNVERWLEVRVVSSWSAPLGIVRLEEGGMDAVAATSYEVSVAIEAAWAERGAPSTAATPFRVVGRAVYADAVLPVATESAREEAMQRATATACEELAMWLVAEN